MPPDLAANTNLPVRFVKGRECTLLPLCITIECPHCGVEHFLANDPEDLDDGPTLVDISNDPDTEQPLVFCGFCEGLFFMTLMTKKIPDSSRYMKLLNLDSRYGNLNQVPKVPETEALPPDGD